MPYTRLLARVLARSGLAAWLPSARHLGSACLRYCSDTVLGAPLDDLAAVIEEFSPRGPDTIDLGSGAPRFDLLPSAGTKLPTERRGWPPFGGLPELRAAAADKLATDNRLSFDPCDEVLITAGALGAVHVALDAFVNPGDAVVLFDPTSPLYPLAVRARRGRVRWLESWVENGRTRFRLEQLDRQLRGARLLVVNSPANPTGGAVAAGDLEQIAYWAERHDALILSDEVLERFHYGARPVSIGTLPRARMRTLTTGSVSKGHALSSARVGWLAAHRQLLRPCFAAAAVREPFVPTLSQLQALAALRAGDAGFTDVRAGFESRLRYACDRLRALELNVALPDAGFFLWVPVWRLGVSGREFARRLLDEYRVGVTPGDLFGPSGAGFVRLSGAVDEGRLQEGLNRLTAFVRGLSGARPEGARRAA